MISTAQHMLRNVSAAVRHFELRPVYGYVTDIRGPVIKTAMDGIRIGEIFAIGDGGETDVLAEAIGTENGRAILSPLCKQDGLAVGARVRRHMNCLSVPCGPALLGRVVDGFCAPIDGGPALQASTPLRPVRAPVSNAMSRPIIEDAFATGLRAIDGPLTIGRGQRLGIFGPPGAGKSTLLAAITRHCDADVVVIGLIGERGREVREFVERDLPATARDRVVVVAATSDRPSVERAYGAHVATTIAECFRDEGKSVLLLIDSLTRVARALREIGLAAGELPARRGYPASVYPALPEIIERSGRSQKGDITALYTVLIEGERQNDPISEEVRSLTDGHIVLSQSLAEAGHYPAINVLESLSRVMPAVASSDHVAQARALRGHLAAYRDIELLVQLGEYRKGTDARTDKAIAQKPLLDAFLRQPAEEATPLGLTKGRLAKVVT